MASSYKKWPAEIQITKVSSSVISQELNLYFVSGVMDKNQRDTLKERMPILSEFQMDDDQWVISTLLNHRQLSDVYELFTRLAKEWRGAYYVITNKFVEACKPLLGVDQSGNTAI